MNNQIVQPTGVPSDCALIIEERTPFDPDTACPLNLGVKTQKALSRQSLWLVGEGAMMLRGSNSPRFAGHDMSTQRKNIFDFL